MVFGGFRDWAHRYEESESRRQSVDSYFEWLVEKKKSFIIEDSNSGITLYSSN